MPAANIRSPPQTKHGTMNLMTTDKNEALDRLPILAGLPDPVRMELVAMSGLQKMGRGSVLFGEGEPCQYVYGLLSGTVALAMNESSAESIVDFIGAGELILTSPAILDLPYMTSGKATTDVLVLLIPATAFREVVKANGELAASIAQTLALQWRRLLNQMKNLRSGDADTRLAQYLLSHVGVTAKIFCLPGSKRQLAAHLGMDPATLSRSFKRLGEFGVTTRGPNITVTSLSRLSAFVSDGNRALPARTTTR